MDNRYLVQSVQILIVDDGGDIAFLKKNALDPLIFCLALWLKWHIHEKILRM